MMGTDLWSDAFRSIATAGEAAGFPEFIRVDYGAPMSRLIDDLGNIILDEAGNFIIAEAAGASVPISTNILVCIEKSAALQPAGFDAQVVAQGITLEAALADLGKAPERGETFTTAAGEVYIVLSVLENDGCTVKVALDNHAGGVSEIETNPLWSDAFRNILTAGEAAGDPGCVRVTYQPLLAPAISNVLVYVTQNAELQPAGFDAQVVAQGITLEAALADLGKEPDRGETFTAAAGTIYTVLSVLENDGSIVKVQVKNG